MSFDPNKPVQLEDGTPARILCHDCRQAGYSLIVSIGVFDHDLRYATTDGILSGSPFKDQHCRLINIPVEHERTYWLMHTAGGTYSTLSVPHGIHGVIAITGPHQVTFKEGEGLEVS